MYKYLSLAVIVSAQFLSHEDANDDVDFGNKCHALALSGGGSHGSYEAGVLWSLVKGKPNDFKWDVITGVSAGSINALAISAFKIGDEMNMIEFLTETW